MQPATCQEKVEFGISLKLKGIIHQSLSVFIITLLFSTLSRWYDLNCHLWLEAAAWARDSDGPGDSTRNRRTASGVGSLCRGGAIGSVETERAQIARKVTPISWARLTRRRSKARIEAPPALECPRTGLTRLQLGQLRSSGPGGKERERQARAWAAVAQRARRAGGLLSQVALRPSMYHDVWCPGRTLLAVPG